MTTMCFIGLVLCDSDREESDKPEGLSEELLGAQAAIMTAKRLTESLNRVSHNIEEKGSSKNTTP